MTTRLILFDLDGTLLDRDRTIRPATLAVLRELMTDGVLVGLATGRSPVSVRRFIDELRPNGPLILLNGCMLWDPTEQRAIATRTLPRADAVSLVRATIELDVHANVYIGQDLFVRRRGPLSIASEAKDGVPHTEVADLEGHVRDHDSSPFKLLCIDESHDFTALRTRFREVLATDCTLVQSEPAYLEVLPPGVDKASMLGEIARHYGIEPGEIMSFGDENNDAELLRASGCGVAMGNANPAILAVADDIIGDHGTDAIAEYLRAVFARPRP